MLAVAMLLLGVLSCGKSEVESRTMQLEITAEDCAEKRLAETNSCDTSAVQVVDTLQQIEAEEGYASEVAQSPKEAESEQSIPAANIFILLLPAVVIAVLGFVCKKKITNKEELTEKEMRTEKWLIGSILGLYVAELVALSVLLLLGVLDTCPPRLMLLVFIFAVVFMLLNAYGAFVANSAILRKYNISFSWKRVFVYVGIALVVGLLFVVVMPLIFDVAITDARIYVTDIMLVSILLVLLFGVDMYRQNPQSLKAMPVIFILFTIGMLMSGALVLLALFVVGLWYVVRSCLVKEKVQEHRNKSLEETNGGESEVSAVIEEETASETSSEEQQDRAE